MLVLSRKRDQRVVIGKNVVITIVDIRGDKVRLGIDAPKDMEVHRDEIYQDIHGTESLLTVEQAARAAETA